MVMNSTRAVDVSIQAVLPVSSAGMEGIFGESERRGAALTRTDAERLLEVEHEELAVADLSVFAARVIASITR